ncbi:spermatogenesis-associated protein 22-like isoform X2 [Acropora millepora]|uniref:spermatogenesis-associated protein 22-like isoform X2 n=1 Tax=Acropora millepora TaxID=45264 RepID=UPI001CF4C4CA|nr:spermatogenesis-associated protein 22-like isoform X2 [Acropora millepora]
MNKRPNSNLSGRLVPIFANNKKKRLKEALYANPTAEEIDRETEHSLSGMGCIYNESNEMGVQKQSCSPAQRFNSEQHKNSGCATNRGEFTNTRTENRYQGILQYEHQVKPVPRRFKNAGDHLSTACTSVTLQNNIPSSHSQKGDESFSGRRSQSFGTSKAQDQKRASYSKGSTKQVNLLATPQDRSLKVITASIQDLFKWKQFEDKMSVIYEIFGILDSQLSLNQACNGKNFIIKDKTGTLRCTFWEMDRHLPRLSRGQMHRCVGSLDRRNWASSNVVSVRPVKPTEQQKLIAVLLELSYKTMQENLAALKEDSKQDCDKNFNLTKNYQQ